LAFKIGVHTSIAGGIPNSVLRAKEIGCTAFQLFTRNPRGWLERPIAESEVESFKSNLSRSGIQKDSVAVHIPHFPKLSGPDSELYEKSVNSFTNELIRTSKLGVKYLVIDLGSDMCHGKENGIKQLIKSCEKGVDTFKSEYKKSFDVTIFTSEWLGL
jgi:deoxyribonuclease-4